MLRLHKAQYRHRHYGSERSWDLRMPSKPRTGHILNGKTNKPQKCLEIFMIVFLNFIFIRWKCRSTKYTQIIWVNRSVFRPRIRLQWFSKLRWLRTVDVLIRECTFPNKYIYCLSKNYSGGDRTALTADWTYHGRITVQHPVKMRGELMMMQAPRRSG